tara:strand:- start:2256 stop:2573 length:318 start_codon:yes stop_codon:yes gene_type:complete
MPSQEDIRNNEDYQTLIRERSKSKWSLAALMLIVYYGFITVLAFKPELFASPIGDGPTSLGIVTGLGVIVFSFLITGYYVHKANTVFEPLTKKIQEQAGIHDPHA